MALGEMSAASNKHGRPAVLSTGSAAPTGAQYCRCLHQIYLFENLKAARMKEKEVFKKKTKI